MQIGPEGKKRDEEQYLTVGADFAVRIMFRAAGSATGRQNDTNRDERKQIGEELWPGLKEGKSDDCRERTQQERRHRRSPLDRSTVAGQSDRGLSQHQPVVDE